MRAVLIAAAIAVSVSSGASAKDMKSCSAEYKTAKTGNALGGQSYLAFMSSCMRGGTSASQTVTSKTPGAPAKTITTTASAAPAASAAGAPQGATAKCKDGTYSMAKHHSGSCSHHGGVATFLQ